jgi:hypothetical protein
MSAEPKTNLDMTISIDLKKELAAQAAVFNLNLSEYVRGILGSTVYIFNETGALPAGFNIGAKYLSAPPKDTGMRENWEEKASRWLQDNINKPFTVSDMVARSGITSENAALCMRIRKIISNFLRAEGFIQVTMPYGGKRTCLVWYAPKWLREKSVPPTEETNPEYDII